MDSNCEYFLIDNLNTGARTHVEQRLLRLFTTLNADNCWIDAQTAACYMFERNDPSSTQVSRAAACMSRLGPSRCYSPDNAGLLERKRVERAVDNGGVYWHYQYRLLYDSNHFKTQASSHR